MSDNNVQDSQPQVDDANSTETPAPSTPLTLENLRELLGMLALRVGNGCAALFCAAMSVLLMVHVIPVSAIAASGWAVPSLAVGLANLITAMSHFELSIAAEKRLRKLLIMTPVMAVMLLCPLAIH
jgi:hypothetical protein